MNFRCLSLALVLGAFAVTSPFARAQNYVNAFGPYRAIPTGSWPECVAIGDVNNDGRNDVVLGFEHYFGATNDHSLLVFLQTTGGTLAAPVRYDASNDVSSIALADFNGDQRTDVAVGRSGAGIRVFLQGGSGALDSFTDYPTANANWICPGDFNNDGRTDLAAIGWGSQVVELFLQTAAGTLTAGGSKSAPYEGYNDIEAGDVNNDGLTDIVVMSGQGQSILSVLLQQPGGFANAVTFPGAGGSGIGIGDLNSDGRKDVAVSGSGFSSTIKFWLQQANGSLAAGPTNASYSIPEPAVVTDVDLNGRDDVLVLHGGWQRLGVYFQTNAGGFTTEQLFEIPYASHYNPHGLAVGDINGDGLPDVAVSDYNNGLIILTNRLTRPIRHLTDIENAAGTARFRLNGESGKEYVIQVSPDLSTWAPFLTNTVPAGGFVLIEDPSAGERSPRFYRAIPQTNVVININDLFVNRITIPAAGGTVQGSNVDATKEPGEFSHGGNPGGKSVWWTWTPSVNSVIAVSTDGSSFDTTLAVYTGTSLGTLQFVAEADDSGESRRSRVLFNAVAGVAYQIAVDGYDGASGSIVVKVTPGAGNDAFANAWPVVGELDEVLGTNIGATRQAGEPIHWPGAGSSSVWWTWQAPATGWVTVSTYTSTFDTVLAVYTGSAISGLTLVGNNDDAGDSSSQVDFFANAGTIYRIAVDGYGGDTGVIWLTVQQ